MEFKGIIKWFGEYGSMILLSLSVISASSLQYLLGVNRGLLALYIVITSTLVTGFLLHLTFNYFGIAPESPLRWGSYVMSGLIGQTFVSVIINHAPEVIKDKFIKKIKGL